jgi:hypothetical protein
MISESYRLRPSRKCAFSFLFLTLTEAIKMKKIPDHPAKSAQPQVASAMVTLPVV